VRLGAAGLSSGLLIAGMLALACSVALLGLDWAAFEDRSSTQTVALLGSLGLLALGGRIGRSPRTAAFHALAGVLLAGAFLTLACLIARYRNPHFFPRRSGTLLEVAALGSLVSSVALYLLIRGGAADR
jgi:hypothetical protein